MFGMELSIFENNKLEGSSNYYMWKFIIQNIFEKNNLWEIIEPLGNILVKINKSRSITETTF
jgi:hypothetical protein